MEIRMKWAARVGALLAAFVAITTASALAQDATQPPLLPIVDPNGVNLATGELTMPGLDVAAGGMARVSQSVLKAATRTVSDVDNFSDSFSISDDYDGSQG